MNGEYWIKKLNLEKHPEGGYYRETYRSQDLVNQDKSLSRYDNQRNACTAIYYLLLEEEFSAFHKLKSDEIFHFYSGETLLVHIINSQGEYQQFKLGNNPDNGEILQLVIPHDSWFACHILDRKSYSLIGCTVAPGFDFADFTLEPRERLIKLYPQYQEIINLLTYE